MKLFEFYGQQSKFDVCISCVQTMNNQEKDLRADDEYYNAVENGTFYL